MSLQSIPKRAIVSIQPDPMSPFEFMNVNDAKEMLNSRHVGGRKVRKGGANLILANTCASFSGNKTLVKGGNKKSRRTRRNRLRKTKKLKSY
jgi:hypothetical protein